MSNCEIVQRQLFNVFNELVSDEGARKSLIQECIELQKKCNTVIDIENVSIQFESDFVKEFEVIKLKLSLTKKKCVILGRTSSGKSTLINALLNAEVLPTDYGSTTNCFVKVKASSTDRNYLIVDNEERNIQDLEHLSNLLSDEHLANGSHITICYDKKKCELLKDDVRIIDTPGYDSGIFDNHLMDKYFKNADIVVLVVSAISGLNEEDKKLVRTFKNTLKQLNFVIIFNFWDAVNSKYHNNIAKREKIKSQFIHKAKHITDILDIDATLADSSIFFVSAFERVKNIAANMPCLNELNEPFTDFFNYLEMKMSESLFTKKYKHLLHLKSKMESILDKCNNLISHINNNRSILEKNIEIELQSMGDVNKLISQNISEIFNNSFETLLIQSLELKKDEWIIFLKRIWSQIVNVINNSSYAYCNENKEQCFRDLFKKITSENFENLKDLEKNLKKKLGWKDISTLQQNILNEIYFPFYFNLNNKLNSIDIDDLNYYLHQIIFKIILGEGAIFLFVAAAISLAIFVPALPAAVASGAATSGVAASGAAASGAAVYGEAAFLSTLFPTAASVAAVGGEAASVAAVGSGSVIASTIIRSMTVFGVTCPFVLNSCEKVKKSSRLPFHFAWKKEEIAIRKLWYSSELDAEKNYETFIRKVILYVTEPITSIKEKVKEIQDKLNRIQ